MGTNTLRSTPRDIFDRHKISLFQSHPAVSGISLEESPPLIIMYVNNDDVALAGDVPADCEGIPVIALGSGRLDPKTQNRLCPAFLRQWPQGASADSLNKAIKEHHARLFRCVSGAVGVTGGFFQTAAGFVDYTQPCVVVYAPHRAGVVDPSILHASLPDPSSTGYGMANEFAIQIFRSAPVHLSGVTMRLPVFNPARIFPTIVSVGNAVVPKPQASTDRWRPDYGSVGCFVRKATRKKKKLFGFVTAGHVVDCNNDDTFTDRREEVSLIKIDPDRDGLKLASCEAAKVLGASRPGWCKYTSPNPNNSEDNRVLARDYAFVHLANSTSKVDVSTIGEVDDWQCFAAIQADGAPWDDQSSAPIKLTGEVRAIKPSEVACPLFKFGARTGLRASHLTGVLYYESVDRSRLMIKTLSDPDYAFAIGGDSGSIVFDESGAVVGMVTQWHQKHDFVVAIPIDEICLELDIEVARH